MKPILKIQSGDHNTANCIDLLEVFFFALIMIIPGWNNPSWLIPALGVRVFPILGINLCFLKPPRTSTELRRLCRVKTRRVGKLEEEPGRRVALHYRLQSGLSH